MEQLINEINEALKDKERWKIIDNNLIDTKVGVTYQYESIFRFGYHLYFNGERLLVDKKSLEGAIDSAECKNTKKICSELFKAYNVKGE